MPGGVGCEDDEEQEQMQEGDDLRVEEGVFVCEQLQL